MRLIQILVLITTALQCKGVSYSEQLDHIARRRLESLGLYKMVQNMAMRRFNPAHGDMSVILGAPSMASHLPEAEAIQPAHTLIRPAVGMLKSAIKFPHKDPENGAGVYGNLENLGIRYDGRNERVMYSGFRRIPSNYIMVAPIESKTKKELSLKSTTIEDTQAYVDTLVKDADEAIKNVWKKTEEAMKSTWTKLQNATEKTFDDIGSTLKQAKYKIFNVVIWRGQPNRRGQLVDEKVFTNIESTSIEEDKKSLDKLFMLNKGDSRSSAEEKKTKLNWFWQSKNAFSHVKFDQNAPEHSELIPNGNHHLGSKLRNWWFLHQDDFQPFKELN